MSFLDLDTSNKQSLEEFNAHLESFPYVNGYMPSNDDHIIFNKIFTSKDCQFASLPHLCRWYLHIKFTKKWISNDTLLEILSFVPRHQLQNVSLACYRFALHCDEVFKSRQGIEIEHLYFINNQMKVIRGGIWEIVLIGNTEPPSNFTVVKNLFIKGCCGPEFMTFLHLSKRLYMGHLLSIENATIAANSEQFVDDLLGVFDQSSAILIREPSDAKLTTHFFTKAIFQNTNFIWLQKMKPDFDMAVMLDWLFQPEGPSDVRVLYLSLMKNIKHTNFFGFIKQLKKRFKMDNGKRTCRFIIKFIHSEEAQIPELLDIDLMNTKTNEVLRSFRTYYGDHNYIVVRSSDNVLEDTGRLWQQIFDDLLKKNIVKVENVRGYY